MTNKIERLCLSAVLSALVFAGACLRIPLPLGYAHLGDCVALFIACLCPGAIAYPAAILGSLLSDLINGYALYAPATILLKAAAVFCVQKCRKHEKGRSEKAGAWFTFLGMALAEGAMALGYFCYEALLYGFAAALGALPGNLAQGALGCGGAMLLLLFFPHHAVRTKS